MKILHIALLCYYTEGMTYQENILPDINAEEGHDVIIVSNASKYLNGEIVETEEEDRILPNGIRLIRCKYDYIGTKLVSSKIQKVSALKKILAEFAPDSIMYHGVCGYELLDVARYVKKHPQTLFYVDSHEDYRNTSRTFLAKTVYKYIHGYFIKKSLPYIRKILYISSESKYYLKDMYKIKDKKMELYPLGGIISSYKEQEECRKKVLEELCLPLNSVLYIHSGKLDALKKTTTLLRSFKRLKKENVYLIIVGSIPQEMDGELRRLIMEDNRILFLGWKTGDELIELLNAADIYCQPGSPSATSQNALCCGCAEILYPYEAYIDLYKNNVLYAENEEELLDRLVLMTNRTALNEYKKKAYIYAKERLDYRKLANRYLV